MFEWIDEGMAEGFENGYMNLSGRNRAVEAVCVGTTPGP